MAVITVVGSMLSGHRLYRWFCLSGDAGAWAGLAVGIVAAYLLLRG